VAFFGPEPAETSIIKGDGNLICRSKGKALLNITLNGEKKEVPDGITVLGLLEFLNIRHQRVAVEMNEMIVKKDRYGEAVINDGDSLEVVSFMGGGGEVRSAEFGVRSNNK
jgi:thiamine biosynthesis protein ThiS